MCEELFYQITNTSDVNQAVFCLLLLFDVCKNRYRKRKKLVLAVASKAEIHFSEFI